MVYPFKKYNYVVLIDGKEAAGFTEVSAPDVTSEPIEYREGNARSNRVGGPSGLVKYGDITLKWGKAVSKVLDNWVKEVEKGTIHRKDVVIMLKYDNNQDAARWTLQSAWPTKYIVDNAGGEMTIESMELAHEGISRDK